MKPITGALAGAVMAGVATYAVSTRTAAYETPSVTPPVAMHFAMPSAPSSPLSIEPVRQTQPVRRTQPVRHQQAPSTVREQSNVREERRDDRDTRSWTKSTLIIGGAAASGAGVGGAVNGKKGALIGAAIGGGAASIYEATQRR
jgi:hypothetical protein